MTHQVTLHKSRFVVQVITPSQQQALERSEVLLGLFGRGVHGVAAGGPPCGTDLIRVLLHVLYRLQYAQCLLHVAPEGQVVDGGVLDDALRTCRHMSHTCGHMSRTCGHTCTCRCTHARVSSEMEVSQLMCVLENRNEV